MPPFILRPTTVQSASNLELMQGLINGITFNQPDATNQDLVDSQQDIIPNGYYMSAGIPGFMTVSVVFNCNGLGLYLDGSLTPIDTNDLPPGFTVIDCDLKAYLSNPGPSNSTLIKRDGSVLITIDDTWPGDGEASVNLGPLTNISLINSFLGVDFVVPPGFSGSSIFSGFRIEGTYEAQSARWAISPTGGNIFPGQRITIIGPSSGATVSGIIGDRVIPLPLQVLSENESFIEVPYPATTDCFACMGTCGECEACAEACAENIDGAECQACLESCLDCLVECLEDIELGEQCQQSTGVITGGEEIEIIIGTQFGGSVVLGTFTILTAEGSGIYRFVMGKINDTLYVPATTSGETYDVKIPDPGAKTGLFRS